MPISEDRKQKMKDLIAKREADPVYQLQKKQFESIIDEATKQSVRSLQEAIVQASGDGMQQLDMQQLELFAQVPSEINRTSPFFPVNRNQELPLEKRTFENSWGRMTITGERLCIHDESVLFALLVMVAQRKSRVLETSYREICGIMGTASSGKSTNAVKQSLRRLATTAIELEVFSGKGKDRKVTEALTNSILSGVRRKEKTGKLQVTVNNYFIETYSNSFAFIDLKLRNQLKGDIAKALLRFYSSQSHDTFSCHILTLASAINLDVNQPLYQIRRLFRNGHKELVKQGCLKRYKIDKADVVAILKTK